MAKINKNIVGNAMQDISAWRDQNAIQLFCSEQLQLGKLALILGAGVSYSCGLPDWKVLIKRCCKIGNRHPVSKMGSEATAEWLLTKCCNNDEKKFAQLVRKALYKGFTTSGLHLAEKELLIALAALSFPSARGGVRQIITFNFDDLLEQLLRQFGVRVQQIFQIPAWESRSDVRIFHPHGLLSFEESGAMSSRIVMAQKHFDKIVAGGQDPWRNTLIEIMSSHTCLFVGLSGTDENLQQLMTTVNDRHAYKYSGYPYWGVRLSDKLIEHDELWNNRGVCNVNLRSFSRIPQFLRGICKVAAEHS